MESSIDSGDPWETQEPEEEQQAAGGVSPMAEATGLFARVRAAGREDTAESQPPDEDDDPDSEPAPVYSPDTDGDAAVESVESVLHELETEPTPVFDLVPPPEEFAPTYEPPQVEADPFDPGVDASPSEPDPAPAPPVHPVADPVEVDDYGLPDIEFGAPVTPEGAELPTGKATLGAEGSITRPILLTTDSVGSAHLAPVDLVVAVEVLQEPSGIPNAVERVLEALRDRCAQVGAEAVVSVTTDIVGVGSVVVVTGSGTAVNLL